MLLQIQHSLLQSHLQDNRHSLPSLQWDRGHVMHPFFQGRHYVEAVKKCKFHFLRVLYTARSSFMQQTPETIFRIHKASCSLVMSEDSPRCIPFAICLELSQNR